MSGILVCLGTEPPPRALEVVSHRGGTAPVGQSVHTAAGTIHFRIVGDRLAAPGAIPTIPAPPGRGDSRHGSIAFDGRIHNAAELWQSLGPGRPAGDGNLAAELLTGHGIAGLTEINGMFALVALDAERQELIAARDRFGLKPLYLYADATHLAFASEIKQLLALPGVAARLDPERALDFLVDGLTDHAEGTMFAGIRRLPAGAALRFDLRQWRLGQPLPAASRYYELPAAGALDLDENEAVRRFRELFVDAVRLCWQPDAAIGLCLSGGLDSAAVTCVAAFAIGNRRNGEELVTLKAFFDDPRYDEPRLYESVLRHTRAASYRCCCHAADALATVDQLVWHLDEPYSRASLAAQWRLFAQAGDAGICVTLGGYRSMVEAHEAHLLGAGGPGGAASSRASSSSTALTAEARRCRWLGPAWRRAAADRLAARARPARPLGEQCRERIYQGDLPMMMRHNDRIGMAHGVETRVPFLDHRLVDLCVGLGNRYKYVRGQTKVLLRHALGDLIPQPVLRSSFKGSYSELEASWLRGPAAPQLAAAAEAVAREWPGIFAAEGVRSLAQDPPRADKETLMLLWRILCFGAWARRFAVGL
jgi:asparagine synthase (glutamine-hydrolysing)